MQSSLSAAQGRALIYLARSALQEKFGRKSPAEAPQDLSSLLSDPALQACCGIFVTLKIGDCLRGCIGTLVGREPLVAAARTFALHAGFDDPRFKALTETELDQVRIEVSVLTAPEPLAFDDSTDLMKKLRPNVDGVTIRKGYCCATFLPQVWAQLPEPAAFLSQLCLKAGLAADAWQTGSLAVETYQVQYFEE